MALECPRTDPIELGIRSTCKRHRLLEGAIVTLGAVVAALAVALASGQNHGGSSSAQVLRSKVVEVTFAADGGDENRRIFNIGGLIVRASCIDYGGGREYLSVAAKSSIDDASRAVVFSQTRAGQELAYAFRAGDFDADDDWSDFLGTNPYGTRARSATPGPMAVRSRSHSKSIETPPRATASSGVRRPSCAECR